MCVCGGGGGGGLISGSLRDMMSKKKFLVRLIHKITTCLFLV